MELRSILLASCLQTCMTYTIAVCTVKNSWWWTEELSETCRVSFQNKFEKLAHLVGFIIGTDYFVHTKLYWTLYIETRLTYIYCQPQCSLVNTVTSLTWLYNTQTHRYNHKYTKQNPTGEKTDNKKAQV